MTVIPILYAGAAGLVAAGFSQFYKVRARRGYPLLAVLLGLSAAFSLLSLAVVLLRGEDLFSADAVLLGLVMGVVTMAAIHMYFLVTQRAKLNVTWTVIQLSLVIPFMASILFYGESLNLAGWLGIGLIAVTLVLFAAGKKVDGATSGVPDWKTGLLLAGSSVFTGIGQVFPKIFTAVSPGRDSFSFIFYNGIGMAAYALGVLLAEVLRRRPAADARRSAPGFRAGPWILCTLMAAFSVFSNILMLLALEGTTGTIAFPLRAATNLVSAFVFSFLLFGEKATVLELAGAGTAVLAVVFISGAR